MLPGGTNKQTREDRVTQLLEAGRLSFAILHWNTPVWSEKHDIDNVTVPNYTCGDDTL